MVLYMPHVVLYIAIVLYIDDYNATERKIYTRSVTCSFELLVFLDQMVWVVLSALMPELASIT